MDANTPSTTLPAIVRSQSSHGATPNNPLGWRGGLVIAAAIAALAGGVAFGVAQQWLSLAALAPLLFTLPCALMMLMCMHGGRRGQTTQASAPATHEGDPGPL